MNFTSPTTSFGRASFWRVGMSFDMNINRKILILLTFNLVCFYTLQAVLGEGSNSGKEGESTNEYEADIMVEELPKTTEIDSEGENEVEKKIEELEKEKKELMKLKNEFQEISKKSKKNEENKVKGKVVYANIEENKVKSEEALSSEEHGISPAVKEEGELESKVALVDGIKKEEKEEIIINKKKDEIINSFEIAENLYKMGGYEKALNIYNLINKEDIEDEKATWITYQIANCYRKLRAFDKALEIYRKLQDEYEGTYWGKQAQWYINEIEWRTEAQDKLEIVGER